MTVRQGDGSSPDPTGEPDVVWQTFEQMPMIMGGFHGPSYVFDATNAAYREWMGQGNVIGRPAPEVYPELIGQELFKFFDRVMETGEATFQQEWRFQADVLGAGELMEFYLDLMIGPRRGPDGSISGVTLWAANVTDRVRDRRAAEREKAAAEQRYQAARDVTISLQQALLPAAVPVLPNFDVAARYLVASRDQAAGGDWFDAVPLPDGSVAVIVGDIVGHGVTASSAMGQLRSVLATALLETGDLTLSLQWADRMATRSPVMKAATVCAAVLEPTSGVLRYTTCGHPRPLVIAPEGTTRYLPASGSGPLGTGSTPSIAEEVLRPGEVLLLYTDGLVERPGRGLDEGLATLARVAGNAVGNRVMPLDADVSTVERVCEQSVEVLSRLGYDDDVTALAIQLRPVPVGALRRQLPATLIAVTELREALHEWLPALDLPRREEAAIELAAGELVANAIEHAYAPDRPGPVRLDAQIGNDGILTITVGDDGNWREPAAAQNLRGRGLWMAGAVMDELHLDHPHNDRNPGRPRAGDDSTGTVVTLRHHLRRPATLVSEPGSSAPSGPDATVEVQPGPPRVLRVSGPLYIATIDAFADHLRSASRGGVQPLAIDLSQVDILASAAVRVLFEAQDEHLKHGHALDLVAAPGSPAQQVLDLVGLPYRTS